MAQMASSPNSLGFQAACTLRKLGAVVHAENQIAAAVIRQRRKMPGELRSRDGIGCIDPRFVFDGNKRREIEFCHGPCCEGAAPLSPDAGSRAGENRCSYAMGFCRPCDSMVLRDSRSWPSSLGAAYNVARRTQAHSCESSGSHLRPQRQQAAVAALASC